MGKTTFPFPLPLIALDGAGALLFALGAAGHFGGVALLAQLLPQVPNVNLVAMGIGAGLMAIAMVGIVRAALQRARQADPAGAGSVRQPARAQPLPPRDRR
jgi:hypothetical protein